MAWTSSTATLVSAAALSFSSQSHGDVIEQRIRKMQSDFYDTEKLQVRLASGSVDKQITDHLLTRAYLSLRDCQNALRALEYTKADQLLNSAALDIGNTNQIVGQDVNIPASVLLNENKEDEYLDSVEQAIPANLSDRKKRTLIYGEQSLVQKMFEKATAHRSALTVFPSDPVERQAWEFSGRYTVENTQWSAYLASARDKLYALQYAETHRMLYEAYREAQKILTQCGVRP